MGVIAWQQQLKESFRKPEELLSFLQLKGYPFEENSFAFVVPKFYAQLMQKGNRNCPLLKQILPTKQENSPVGKLDPLEEEQFMLAPSIMRKFQSRILVIASGHCAINCRYCFRRNFPYSEHRSSISSLLNQLEKIELDSEVFEVILSGGDPLTLTDHALEKIVGALDRMKNVEIIRFHSRLPVVLPDRVNDSLLKIFSQSSKKVVLVTHINHPQEISASLIEKVSELKRNNVDILNQAVLLKDVNDDFVIQKNLWKKATLAGITAYYLHQLDPVQGAMHFHVDVSHGQRLIEQLRSALPGYMVPQYVREVPHAPYKVNLSTYRDVTTNV